VSGQSQVPVALLPGKEQLIRRLGGSQGQAERFERDTYLLTTATAVWFPWLAKKPTCDFTLKPTSVVTMA